MSLKTWKEEFYPTEAKSQKARKAPVAHSLRKWTGLTKSNLRKHKVHREEGGNEIFEQDNCPSGHLSIDCDTCACCQVHGVHIGTGHADCSACLLSIVSDGAGCDGHNEPNDWDEGPYWEFIETGSTRNMLKLLQKALKAGYK